MIKGESRIIAVNLVLALFIAGAGWWGWKSLNPAEAPVSSVTTKVSIGDVIATISASGKIISPGDVAINPTINGTLTAVNVKVGQRVQAGQVLAQLDSTAQRTALTQANSALQTAKANKAKLKRVRTAAEETQVNLQIAQSKNAIAVAQKNLDDQTALLSANALTYQGSVDSAKTALDNAKSLVELNKITYQNSVDTAKNSMENAKPIAEAARVKFTSYQAAFGEPYTYDYCASSFVPNSVCANIVSYYNSYQTAKNNLDSATNSYNSAINNQKINLAKDEQNIASLQTAYENALKSQANNLKKDEQTLASLKNSVTSAQTSYDLLQAQLAVAIQPATESEIATADAQLATANANYSQAQKNLAATSVRSPVTGDVASIANSVGQTVSTGSNNSNNNNNASTSTPTGFIVLTNVSSLRVQATFSEADAAKVKVGQEASFTFEALTDVSASGLVAQVDLLPTVTNNVVSFGVLLDINDVVPGLKPGMTATATVTTGFVSNVIRVAPQTITTRGSRTAVSVVTMKGTKESKKVVPVTVGLRGDSFVEIQSGLKVDDVVAINTTARTATNNGFPQGGLPAGVGGLTGSGLGGGGGGGRGGGGGGGGRN